MGDDKIKLDRRGILPGYAAGRYESTHQYDPSEFAKTQYEDPVRRDNRISIRVSGVDMTELHRQALAEGLPVQSLLAQGIHQYATGQLIKVPLLNVEADAARQDKPQRNKKKTPGNTGAKAIPKDPA